MNYVDPIYGPITVLKKPNGKSKAIIIDYQTQSIIKSFKERYRELLNTDDEIRPIDKITISVVLNELDEFDQNILIAFYALADSSPTKLGKVMGVAPSVITNRINKIIKYVRNRSSVIAADSGIHS
jgi:hypothetical protein